MQAVNRNPASKDLHAFGWAMLGGFGVLGVALWYGGHDPHGWSWVAAAAQKTAFGLWCLGGLLFMVSFSPGRGARPVYVAWMSAALFMGAIVTVVLLSVLFVVLLPAFALVRFADPLRMKLLAPEETYWENHKHHESTLERMARPF